MTEPEANAFVLNFLNRPLWDRTPAKIMIQIEWNEMTRMVKSAYEQGVTAERLREKKENTESQDPTGRRFQSLDPVDADES